MTITKRKNKNGECSYRIRVFLGHDRSGKQIIKSMTYIPDDGMSAKQAEREAYKQGIIFEEKCEREKEFDSRVKFRILADEWLNLMETTQKIKASTLASFKSLRDRTYQALGDMYVDDISYKIIQNFILKLSKPGANVRNGKGLSQKSQKQHVTFISDVMKYALKCDLIPYNPCKDISTVKTVTRPIEPYSLDEAKSLLNAINQKAPLHHKVFFYILCFSGVRRGEALGLEFKDVDFNSGIVKIVRTSNYRNNIGIYTETPKTKSSQRQLYFHPFLIEMIKDLKLENDRMQKAYGKGWQDTDRLFIMEDGSPIHPNTPYTWLERFCKREGLSFKGLHAFRHFVATQALADGVNIKEISSMLGHSLTSTTLNVYAHSIENVNKTAFNAVANLLLN